MNLYTKLMIAILIFNLFGVWNLKSCRAYTERYIVVFWFW